MLRNSLHPSVTRPTPARNEDFFEPDEIARMRDYIAPLRRNRRIRLTLGFALDLVVIFWIDLSPRAAGWVGSQGWFVRLLVVAAVLEVISVLVRAPFSYWANLVYEKRAGHSTMTVGTWLKDLLLNFVLEVVLGAVLLAPVYAAIHHTDWWWLLGGLALAVVLTGIQFVGPVLIAPRFNKFTPLEEGPIRARIEEIAALSRVTISGAYLMDASKRTSRANAGVMGFGRLTRVVVNDTFCEYPIEQLAQVIAHELGHYRLRHTLKSIPAQFLTWPVAFAFAAFVVNDTVLGWAGITSLGDPASFALLGLAIEAPMTAMKLVSQWVSRKHEREADLEALELLEDPTAFVAVWPEMVLADKANLEPTPWERLMSTHPEIAERMQFGIDWAELNGRPIEMPPRRSVPAEAGATVV